MKLLFVVLLSIFTLSCGPKPPGNVSSFSPIHEKTTLQVNNNTGSQLVVYAEGRRLATIMRSTECIDISDFSTRLVSFGFKFIAEPTIFTPDINVGNALYWVIDINAHNHRSLIYDMNTIRPTDEPCND